MTGTSQNEMTRVLKDAAVSTRGRARDFFATKRKFISDLSNRPPSSYLVDFATSLRTPEFELLLQYVSKFQCKQNASGKALSRIFRLVGDELDSWTRIYDHSYRAGRIAKAVAKELNTRDLSEHDCFWGGMFHDVGKLFVGGLAGGSDELFNRYRNEFMVIIRAHAPLGASVLERFKAICPLGAAYAREHHEAPDGSGYPKGLRQKDISIPGQIARLADIYDALVERRGWEMSRILNGFRDYYIKTGIQEDPVFNAFTIAAQKNHKQWYQEIGEG